MLGIAQSGVQSEDKPCGLKVLVFLRVALMVASIDRTILIGHTEGNDLTAAMQTLLGERGKSLVTTA